MKKLKVIQIIDSLNVGGTEVLAVNIANTFITCDVESHLCTTRKEGFLKEKINDDVGYIYLNKKLTFDIKALLKLKKYIKLNNINVIHAHSTSLFFSCCLKVLYPNIRLFWHNHTGANYHLKGIKFRIIRFLSHFSDGIINVNSELNEWSKKRLKHKNTVKLNNFPLFMDLEIKTKLYGEENKRIVSLAALRPEKDHLNLLKAFKEVNKAHSDWTLHLIGKDYKNEYSKKIKNYIIKENLIKSVYLYDMCSDIKNILEQASIGVLSSENEGLPISLLEYGLANLPVLTTDVGECKNVINHHKAIVVPKRSDIFAKALIEIIENDLLKNEISESLNNNVISTFSKEKFIFKVKNFYNNK